MDARLFRCIFSAFVPLTIFTACLSGCAASPQPLYSWETYESQVYAYFKGENWEGQIDALERDKAKIEAGDKAIPPGFYAHLGLLYTETGNHNKAIACFEAENALFPESAVYMDFILGNYRR